MRKVATILLLAVGLSGCARARAVIPGSGQPDHIQGLLALAAGQGFLDQAKLNHPECNPKLLPDDPLIIRYGLQTQNKICVSLYAVIAAHIAAHTALDAWCASTPGWGTPGINCHPPKTIEAEKLRVDAQALLVNFEALKNYYNKGKL